MTMMPPSHRISNAYWGMPSVVATAGSPGTVPMTEMGPIVQSGLANGAMGYFQQTPLQRKTSISFMLPLSASLGGTRDLILELLNRGKEANSDQVTQRKARGIQTGISLMGEGLLVTVSGPAGQESELMQAAWQDIMQPFNRPVTPIGFETIKQTLMTNYQYMLSDPAIPLGTAVSKALYGQNHPYAFATQEIINQMARQTPASVLDVYQKAVRALGQAKVLMVSPQSVETQQSVLNQFIQQAGWYGNPHAVRPLPVTPPVAFQPGVSQPALVPNESLEQIHLMTAWRAPGANDPDYPAFKMLEEIMGGFGRIFKVMRTQKGLVYSTNNGASHRPLASDYSIHAQIDFDKLSAALQGIQQVTQELMQVPVSDQELDMAKRHFLRNRNLIKQTTTGVASLALEDEQQPRHPDELWRAIQQVTPQDIQRVANRVFNPTQGYQAIGVSAPQSVLNQYFAPAKP